MEIVYTFSSTHAVIAAEANILSAKIKAKVRPIPTVIRAGCGLMLCIALEDKTQADQILASKNIPVEAVYTVSEGKYIPFV